MSCFLNCSYSFFFRSLSCWRICRTSCFVICAPSFSCGSAPKQNEGIAIARIRTSRILSLFIRLSFLQFRSFKSLVYSLTCLKGNKARTEMQASPATTAQAASNKFSAIFPERQREVRQEIRDQHVCVFAL